MFWRNIGGLCFRIDLLMSRGAPPGGQSGGPGPRARHQVQDESIVWEVGGPWTAPSPKAATNFQNVHPRTYAKRTQALAPLRRRSATARGHAVPNGMRGENNTYTHVVPLAALWESHGAGYWRRNNDLLAIGAMHVHVLCTLVPKWLFLFRK